MTFLRPFLLALALVIAACGPSDPPAPSDAPARGTTDRIGAVTASSRMAAQTALYELFVRDFSAAGDFQGVIDGLDRVEATGVEVVWLMPIHPIGELNRKGTLGSPYSIRDYRAINPDFGDKQDFRSLVDAIHERDMKIILGWVPNHTAWDHVWVREHPDYYVHDADGEMIVPRDLQGNPTDWTDVAQLDYSNPDLRRAMIDAMRYWIEEFDVDGFRVDVAGFVPSEFYREAIPELRAAKDGVLLMLAEWGDVEMHESGFDLTYPWSSYHLLKEVWNGAPARTFVEAEMEELADMPPGGYRLRMTTNHDETAWDAPPVELFNGSAGARAAFVAMMLLPGPPLLYNGQEVESPQTLPLFEKETIEWDRAGADEARAFYRSVIELARTEPDLVGGSVESLTTDADDDVIGYRRDAVVVVVNTRASPLRVSSADISAADMDVLLVSGVEVGETLSMEPYGFVVLRAVDR